MKIDFAFDGLYRVQSRRIHKPGCIAGEWFFREQGLLSSEAVNASLSLHPQWSGVPINLRGAIVTERSGMFQDSPDILYKMEFFEPQDGTPAFPHHIVDVLKAEESWIKRWPLVSTLFVENQADMLAGMIDDLELTIVNEYYCHEAGHVLGRPVQEKVKRAYFSPEGKAVWPLIWIEEFRADLHSYATAVRLLKARDAASIFVYNCLLRLGVDRLAAASDSDGYGTIPFLLFSLLIEFGFLRLIRTKTTVRLSVADLSVEPILKIMNACDQHATDKITDYEIGNNIPLDWALNAARYYHDKLAAPLRLSDYMDLLNAPLALECIALERESVIHDHLARWKVHAHF